MLLSGEIFQINFEDWAKAVKTKNENNAENKLFIRAHLFVNVRTVTGSTFIRIKIIVSTFGNPDFYFSKRKIHLLMPGKGE
jgi:hypothetical protein